MRTFIAISLPDSCKEKCLEVGEKLKKLRGTKVVKGENLHMTLKFLGEVPEEKITKLSQALEELKGKGEFSLTLKGLGAFPNPNYIKVVWVGVEEGQEKVEKLHQIIDKNLTSLGFKKDKRFHPHFTLARVKKASKEEKKQLQKLLKEYRGENFGQFSVKSLQIMKSKLTPQGPIYSSLQNIPL